MLLEGIDDHLLFIRIDRIAMIQRDLHILPQVLDILEGCTVQYDDLFAQRIFLGDRFFQVIDVADETALWILS